MWGFFGICKVFDRICMVFGTICKVFCIILTKSSKMRLMHTKYSKISNFLIQFPLHCTLNHPILFKNLIFSTTFYIQDDHQFTIITKVIYSCKFFSLLCLLIWIMLWINCLILRIIYLIWISLKMIKWIFMNLLNLNKLQ